MSEPVRRIALNCGGGWVPGLNAVVRGAVFAASRLGWEVVGIRDGYDGLLVPERFPEGGLLRLDPRAAGRLDTVGDVLGTGARIDPFRMRTVDAENQVAETDRSDDLLARLREEGIDAVVSIVGGSAVTGSHALTVAFRLARKGLRTVCIPKSVENDLASTALAFGYNSALGQATALLDRIRTAALDSGRLAVVEVPGRHAGWLALQSGMAAHADAVLIPEIPYDLDRVALRLLENEASGRTAALVVAAEGAAPASAPPAAGPASGLRASLSPLSDPSLGGGGRVLERTGLVAEGVARELGRRTGRETFPMALGHLVRGGEPTAVDRQLGVGCGAAAVRALEQGEQAVLVSFQPPELTFVPLADAIHRVRTVPPESEFVTIARALGLSLGD